MVIMKKILLILFIIGVNSAIVQAQAYRSMRIAPSTNYSTNEYQEEPRRGDVRLSFEKYDSYVMYWLHFEFYSNGTVEAQTRKNENWKTGTYTLQDIGKEGTAYVVKVNIRWSNGRKESAKLYYYSNKIELSYDRTRWSECK